MSAAVIDLHGHRHARQVQDLARAVRHRSVTAALAQGALAAVITLAEHAVRSGGLDYAGALGLHLAVTGARDAAAELAEAHYAVETMAGEMDHAS